MLKTARFLLLALAALSISACDTTPVREDRAPEAEEPVEEEGGVELIPLEEEGVEPAFDLEEVPEDLGAAIERDLREALGSTPPVRQTAYLDAVNNLIVAGRLEDAELVLDKTDVSGLSRALEVRKRLLRRICVGGDNCDLRLRHVGEVLRGYRRGRAV